MDTTTTPSLKPVEIFRPGTFTALSGRQFTFTEAQVRELADTYNPEFSDAPFVVGHPKVTSPRFGRAGKLFVNDAGVLCAEPADVVPEFAAAVNAKHYPKVSASIFLPHAPGNPTPGKHYLRHVGFLGGVAPAVKGLAMVEFAAPDDDGIVEFGYQERIVTRVLRGIRDWLIETAGMEKAEQVIPAWDLDSLEAIAAQEQTQDQSGVTAYPAFSDPTQPTEAELTTLAEQQAELAARQKQLETREAAVRALEAKASRTQVADFAECLVTDGKLLPGQKDSVVEILAQLESVNQIADFAAGDENHGKTGADLFKTFLGTLPKLVEFNRVTPAATVNAGIADFAAPPGEAVDQEGLELLNKANAYVKANPGTPFIEAVKAVQATA